MVLHQSGIMAVTMTVVQWMLSGHGIAHAFLHPAPITKVPKCNQYSSPMVSYQIHAAIASHHQRKSDVATVIQKTQQHQDPRMEPKQNGRRNTITHKGHCSTHRNRLLTQQQEAFLESLDETIYGSAFLEKLKDLQEFKNIHGTCLVPKRYAENPPLGNWVNKTRQLYRKYRKGENSSMTPERIEILNQMGFVWCGNDPVTGYDNGTSMEDASHIPFHPNNQRVVSISSQSRNPKEQSWKDNFQEMKQWMLQDPSLLKSKAVTTRNRLGVWAAHQRGEYHKFQLGQKANITQEKIDLLNSIGFDWNPWETKWKTRIKELKEYQKGHGNCLVPVNYAANPKLGRWVATQRKYYKLYQEGKPTSICQERINELTEIGFAWNRWEDTWMDTNKQK